VDSPARPPYYARDNQGGSKARDGVSATPGFRPLYRQVYEYLVRQVSEGAWRPGEALPSEQALARELGVSQGTVRKALDALAVEGIMERRQGKGTFIAANTQERSLFKFFRLSRPGGERVTPQRGEEQVRRRAANQGDIARLGLSKGDKVVEIRRIRLVDGEPALFEMIVVPAAVFPDIENRAPLPNALYSLYQSDYGINITTAHEELKADLARKDDAAYLKLSLGAPVLQIDRLAVALDGRVVEWRVSRCDTRNFVYAVTLG